MKKLFLIGVLVVVCSCTLYSMAQPLLKRLAAVQQNSSFSSRIRVPAILDQVDSLQTCVGFNELLGSLDESLGKLESATDPVAQQTLCNKLNGVLFELEAAHRVNQIEPVRGVNLKISLMNERKQQVEAEFDVVTDTVLYECKSVTYWKCTRNMRQLLQQRRFIGLLSKLAPTLLGTLDKQGTVFDYEQGKAITVGSYHLLSNWVFAADPSRARRQLREVITVFSNKQLNLYSKFAMPSELVTFLERQSIPYCIVDSDDAQDT